MSFQLNINNILRLDIVEKLKLGKEYPFEKEGLHVLADDIQIWLTTKDWTPLGEIQVTSQTRAKGKTTGTFIVKHVYGVDEQKMLGNIFRRMYGW